MGRKGEHLLGRSPTECVGLEIGHGFPKNSKDEKTPEGAARTEVMSAGGDKLVSLKPGRCLSSNSRGRTPRSFLWATP